ncbi:hypothetical protein OC845_005996 [Tilletia horrida]|nr:hypothetical protein OC845_005996 [Tilletia horrida]
MRDFFFIRAGLWASVLLVLILVLSSTSDAAVTPRTIITQTSSDPQSQQHIFQPNAGQKAGNDYRRARGTDQKAVQWDKYSMIIAGKRTFFFSVEFHPWRLPVPGLWRDVLDKVKAAGFNCVSIYTHWGLMQPTPDPASLNFEGMHNLGAFLDLAKEVGLFVIVRPGPYINAETTAGGMATWTTRLNVTLRTNATEFEQAWTPYLSAIADVVKPRQIVWDGDSPGKGVSGGSVIAVQADNEYHSGPTRDAYIRSLVKFYKDRDFWVPITYNDIGQQNSFVDIVDLWGLDSYPLGFDCSHPEKWQQIPDDYLARHERTNPDEPFIIPEWQGGSYDPYGGEGYGACAQLTGPAFTKLATEAMLAQRVTWLSFYMGYGGTNWGALAAPDVYSSYDYAASISESRQLTPKYGAVKALAHLIRSFPDLAKTERVSVDKRKDGLMVSELRNPDSKAAFYFIRHIDAASHKRTKYQLNITTSQGVRTLPAISRADSGLVLNGRSSLVICTDRILPGGHHLLYTTASIFYAGAIDGIDTIVMYANPEDGQIETAFANPFDDAHADVKAAKGPYKLSVMHSANETLLHFDLPQVSTSAPAKEGEDDVSWLYFDFGGAPLLLVYARDTAIERMQASGLATGANAGFDNFWDLGSTEEVVLSYLSEPGLVRSSTYGDDGRSLFLTGQTNTSTTFLRFVGRWGVQQIFWNGDEVQVLERDGPVVTVGLPGPSKQVIEWRPPVLEELSWMYADSLPELKDAFDADKEMVPANKTSADTSNPFFSSPIVQTQDQVLFASEYGFHGNFIVWRGSFDIQGKDEGSIGDGLELHLQGGKFFAYSVWLNGRFLGSAYGDKAHGAVRKTFDFDPEKDIKHSEKNTIVIVMDHTGIEMEYGDLPIGLDGSAADLPADAKVSTDRYEAVKLPRGIIAYDFVHSRKKQHTRPQGSKLRIPKVTWHVAGNLGGEQSPDRVRSHLNEGGLYGERQGWHLPGAVLNSSAASTWEHRSPFTSSLKGKAGVGFFRTEFVLDVPEYDTHDVALAFVAPPTRRSPKAPLPRYRALLFVNGWQVGKYVPDLGPQNVYPVPQGILDYNGTNTLAVAIWNMEERSAGDGADGQTGMGTLGTGGLRLEVVARWKGAPGDGRDVIEVNNPGWQELRGQVL